MTAPLKPVTAVAMKTLRERAEDWVRWHPAYSAMTTYQARVLADAFEAGFYDCADREDSNETE